MSRKENEVLVKWIGYEVVAAAWVVRSKAATVCSFWIMYSCLIWQHKMDCLFYNALLQTGLLFLCTIIV